MKNLIGAYKLWRLRRFYEKQGKLPKPGRDMLICSVCLRSEEMKANPQREQIDALLEAKCYHARLELLRLWDLNQEFNGVND
jgi:hypothetical protein